MPWITVLCAHNAVNRLSNLRSSGRNEVKVEAEPPVVIFCLGTNAISNFHKIMSRQLHRGDNFINALEEWNSQNCNNMEVHRIDVLAMWIVLLFYIGLMEVLPCT